MIESWEMIKMYFSNYWGKSIYFILFALCLLYIFIFDKEKRRIFVYPSIILAVLIFNPWLYKYIWQKLFVVTFWRIFWLIPLLPVMAYTFIDIINRMKKKVLKALAMLVVVCIIVLQGQYMYTEGVFTKATNPYKLPQEAVDVADALLKLDEEPRAVIPPSLYCYIRQYSADIKMMYGRNMEGYLRSAGVTGESWSVNRQMQAEEPDESKIARVSRETEYPYIVAAVDRIDDIELDKYGYKLINEVAGYNIYQDEWTGNKQLEWQLEKHINEKTGDAFVTIMDDYDRLLVIDGGTIRNTDYVRKVMAEKGNEADVWIITNTGIDISGAFFMISNELKEVRYWEAFFPDLVEHDDYMSIFDDNDDEFTTWDEAVYSCYQGYKKKTYNVKGIGKEETADVIGLSMRVMNSYEGDSKDADKELRDSSLIIQLQGEEDSLLYISDVTDKKITELIEEYGEQLKSDYLIWNCREKDMLPILQETVKAETVISLNEGPLFEGRLR